ncbi:ABC transporter permease [Fodinicurvata sp. EGI_FJ10296]|uniref:ABC transporter permease n=1 Tax=Fodinicurvata sp. EGI_FJ10296 TaxID=3231908 RepID=UPI003456B882
MTIIANRVLTTLLVSGVVGVSLMPFASHAPNRIVSGTAFGIAEALSPWHLAIAAVLTLVLAVAATPALSRLVLPRLAAGRTGAGAGAGIGGPLVALGAAPLLLLTIMYGAGDFATRMTDPEMTAARTSLGGAFWVAVFSLTLIMMDGLQRLRVGSLVAVGYGLAVGAAVFALFAAGVFDDLSILREYANRRSAFTAAMSRHIFLVAGALGPALLIGIALGLWALRRKPVRGGVFGLLNFFQTIPSIALFGLLIAPLAALGAAVPLLFDLGVRGIGMAPALLALVMYALLPIARNTYAGFAAVPTAVIEAARGMGMSRLAILLKVEAPLALPILLSGLRIVVVQLIGLAVVAALIGAGGLGSFIFQGLGQNAIDLVLLGAIPTIAMAVLADGVLQVFISLSQPRGQA